MYSIPFPREDNIKSRLHVTLPDFDFTSTRFVIIFFVTYHTIMSRDQNTGRSHSMKTDNSSTVRVEEFRYLGTTLTDQNSIQEQIKSRMKFGNACY